MVGSALRPWLLGVFGAGLVACGPAVDNSGGDPPAGTDVSVERPGEVQGQPCPGNGSEAMLLDDEAAVTAWMADCSGNDGVRESVLLSLVSDQSDQKRLVGVRMIIGGCVRSWDLMGIYHDGDALNVWALLQDQSYGIPDAACTDDLIFDEQYFWVTEGDYSAVTHAALFTGTYNPDLPGAPDLPG